MRQIVLSLNSLVLLCLYGDFVESDVLPLTNSQWNQLEFKLAHSTLKQPSGLLDCSDEEMMIQLVLSEDEVHQIKKRLSLMQRVLVQLACYERRGIGVVTKFEEDYPDVFYQRLKKNAPLILYYCGNYQLLNQEAVSIAGPVHSTKQMNINTRHVVDKVFQEGYHLMTSAHQGCEMIGLVHQLRLGGHVILFAANDLARKQYEFLKFIHNQRMLVISHRKPDSEYDVVESVVRNSYIYALCTTNFVIHSELNTGALWFSAMQNLKHRWSKMLAIVDDDFYGNAKLVEAGAIPVTMEKVLSECTIEEMMEISKQDIGIHQDSEQISIFDFIEDENLEAEEIEQI